MLQYLLIFCAFLAAVKMKPYTSAQCLHRKRRIQNVGVLKLISLVQTLIVRLM